MTTWTMHPPGVILPAIRRACTEHDIPPSLFGRRAVNDPALVRQLTEGHKISDQRIERIKAFIASGCGGVRRKRADRQIVGPALARLPFLPAAFQHTEASERVINEQDTRYRSFMRVASAKLLAAMLREAGRV